MSKKRNKLKNRNTMLVEQNLRLLEKVGILKKPVTKRTEEQRFRTIQRTVSKLQQTLEEKNALIKCLREEK